MFQAFKHWRNIPVKEIDPFIFRVVTNFKELRYLKKIFKLTTTNMEEGMFVEPTDDEYLGLGVQIFLKPKERVFIPFKYQTFRTNHNVQPQVKLDISYHYVVVVLTVIL